MANAFCSSIDGDDEGWNLKDSFGGDKYDTMIDKANRSKVPQFFNFFLTFFFPFMIAPPVFSAGFLLEEAGMKFRVLVPFFFLFFFF